MSPSATNVSTSDTFFTNLHISAWGRLPLRPQAERCLRSRVVGVSARIKVPSIRVSRGSQHFVFNPVVVRTMFRIGHVFAQVLNQLDQCVPATLRCERPSTSTTRNRGHSIYVKGWVKGHLVAKSFTAITQEIVLLCTVTAALCSGTLVSRRKCLHCLSRRLEPRTTAAPGGSVAVDCGQTGKRSHIRPQSWGYRNWKFRRPRVLGQVKLGVCRSK